MRKIVMALVSVVLAVAGCTINESPPPRHSYSTYSSGAPACGSCGLTLLNGKCFAGHPGASCACGGVIGPDRVCMSDHTGVRVQAPVAPPPQPRPATTVIVVQQQGNCSVCGMATVNGHCNGYHALQQQPQPRQDHPCHVCGRITIGGRCYSSGGAHRQRW